MPELLEKEAFEETEITITKEYTNEDLLDRQPFIDKVKTIIELQAAQKKNCCFAINGSWGVGKTFVLNKLEEQLELETNVTDKYLIFRYNCWQYDYYEEPLVAIVSSMLDTIDEKEKLISKENKAKIKGVLKAVGSALLIKANETIEDKTGFNPKELIDIVTDAGEFSAERIEDEHKYDSNFIFKATLKKLQDTLKTLSADKTIIFIVDELDRCLPEYAIKVLERLHHIFEEVSNVQVILSIDKGQLKHIVKNTFGEGTEAEKYLSKFIRFYMNLDESSIDEELFDLRFRYYTDKFKLDNTTATITEIGRFKALILAGIDIRQRIEIIDKCNLLHSFFFKDDEKADYYFMCVELFLSVLKTFKIVENRNQKQTRFNITNIFGFEENEFQLQGLKDIAEIFKKNFTTGRPYYTVEVDGYVTLNVFNVYGVILVAYMNAIQEDVDNYNLRYVEHGPHYIIKHARDFWDLLQVIS